MSDNPMFSFAIGSLAASRGASDLSNLSASIFKDARTQSTVDVDTLLAVAQALEQLLEQKDVYIAGLQREISELRAYAKKVEADRNTLLDWTEKAEAELKWRRSIE